MKISMPGLPLALAGLLWLTSAWPAQAQLARASDSRTSTPFCPQSIQPWIHHENSYTPLDLDLCDIVLFGGGHSGSLPTGISTIIGTKTSKRS